MAHYMQKFKYPIKYYIMSTIQDLCNGDKTLKFKLSDLDSLIKEREPGITPKQIRRTSSSILVGGGFIRQAEGRRVHPGGLGRAEAFFSITQKGIDVDPHTLPSSKVLAERRKASGKSAKPKIVPDVEETGDDLDKTSYAPPNFDEIDKLIESVELKDFTQEQISYADLFTQQFLIFIKSQNEEINKLNRSLESAQRNHERIVSDLKGELRTKERDMGRLNERITKMTSIIQGYKKHENNKKTSIGTLGDVFKKTYPSRS